MNENNQTLLYGGKLMNTTKTETETRYVITADGIRMSYEEYIDMIKSERI